MKSFDIPNHYRSQFIAKVKAVRKSKDPRKKDFVPTILDFGKIQFKIARHFGFCFGVENAIEKAYKAIQENPNNNVYLLSQMIHNPGVNEDLLANGVQFLQDTNGQQLIPFNNLSKDDIVIIPAFGTTIEIQNRLNDIGVITEKYNTTCPFVEKVWNRSEKLGQDNHTIIIHGKFDHEETRATFSHARQNAASLVIKDMKEAVVLGDFIKGNATLEQFEEVFNGKYSASFHHEKSLCKIGVVNQTTMLASETQVITDYLRQVMIDKYGEQHIKEHIADTRDTLCYATNDNQNATLALVKEKADFAIVVGGYNSSNTTHLVEVLEKKFNTYFIKDQFEILDINQIQSFNIHDKSIESKSVDWNDGKTIIALTSGASCPDAVMDGVIQKILNLLEIDKSIEDIIIE